MADRYRFALRVTMLVVAGVLVAGVLAIIGAATMVPRCGMCHLRGEFKTATTSLQHASVKCEACHADTGILARTTTGFQQALHVAPGGGNRRDAAAVPDARCESCHRAIKTGVQEARGIRIRHDRCARKSSCVDCHSSTAHGAQTSWPRTYTMDGCLHCHGQIGTQAKCDSCHEDRGLEQRLARGTWAVTHGRTWRKAHGMGDLLTCSACHFEGFCDKCHGPGLPHNADFRTDHPVFYKKPGSKCKTCHRADFCTSCHGVEMPHSVKFKIGHKTTVKSKGEKVCKNCHQKTDCVGCHEKHVHPGGALKPKTPLLRDGAQ